MARRFEDVEQGDQLELPAHRGSAIYGAGRDRDPNRVVRVSIVTDIWFDPVEEKEFIALAHLRSNGEYGKPTEKRTIRGLAQCGYRAASRDWVKFLKDRAAASDSGEIVPMFKRR
mgnify:CR=1 FL=1